LPRGATDRAAVACAGALHRARFFQLRFGGRWPRILAAWAAVLCSFTYVVAQIYGVGLIASRLTGVQFEIGIMLGLGGVLLCSFLGGMRAITWTQVAQYIVLLLAFLIPVSWLSYQQLGNPMAPLVYGAQIGKIAELEEQFRASPAEREVARAYLQRALDLQERLRDVEGALQREREKGRAQIQALRAQNADVEQIVHASQALAALPRDAAQARERWTREMRESFERAHPLAACRTLGVDSENGPQRGQFLPDSLPHSGTMGQEDGKNGPLRRIRSRRFQSPTGCSGAFRRTARPLRAIPRARPRNKRNTRFRAATFWR